MAENAVPAVGAPKESKNMINSARKKKNLEMKDKICSHFNTLPKTKM